MSDGGTPGRQGDGDGDWPTRPAKLPINVADLRRRLGQRRTEPIDLILSRQTVVGSRTTDAPVRGEVVIESIERGVSVRGELTFTWEGDCRRCLEVTGGDLTIDIDEIFQVDAPEDSELLALEADQIDLVPIVRDAVLLSLPLAPLCGSDCAGPDPDRYPAVTADVREQDRAAEAAATPDPRWAALDQLKLEEN